MACGNRRDALLEKLSAAKPAFPKPRPPNGKQPSKRWMRLARRPSIGDIATTWSVRHVNAGYPRVLVRFKSLATWTIRLPLRGWRLGRAVIGPKVSLDDFGKRMAVCGDCQSMQKRLVRKSPFVKLYCGSCGCPRWPLSELDRTAGDLRRRRPPGKNWLLKWTCPLNKHERLDDPPEWKDIIEKERKWAEPKPEPADSETI